MASKRGSRSNPVPEPGSRWINIQRERKSSGDPPSAFVVVIDRTWKDENREDIRIQYHREDNGHKREVWYKAFKLPGNFRRAPPQESPSPSPPSDGVDGEAARNIVKRIEADLAALKLIVERMR
jgi:hypothetical protein